MLPELEEAMLAVPADLAEEVDFITMVAAALDARKVRFLIYGTHSRGGR